MKTIISLFDHSGNWSQPYADQAVATGEYDVYRFDIKDSLDILDFDCEYLFETWGFSEVHGILAAVPCTDFSSSGAQYWGIKDSDGRTEQSVELVYQVLRCVELFGPEWWCIENPVGRLPTLIPSLGRPWYFNPCDFGDPYTKKTGLWGDFNVQGLEDRKTPVDPTDNWLMRLGGKSERTKELRSVTPPGFSSAWFQANP